MTNEMQTRFAQFAAVERLTEKLQGIKDQASQARKGWKQRNAAAWTEVRDEAAKQLTALGVPTSVSDEPSNVTELALAQKEQAK